jgi:hypothetical protein
MRDAEDITLNRVGRHRAEIGNAEPRRERGGGTRTIVETDRALWELYLVLPSEDNIRRSWGSGDSQIGKIQLELDANELHARRATISNVAVLNGQ